MSINKIALFLFLFFGVVASIQAQKIKYKDLFILLNAKNFEKGETFLRRFLIQDPDHPNANFNMAFLYVYKMNQLDMLKDAEAYISYADSTIIYYQKANSYITEKEVRKHDDYYQDYFRRDLRSGKYGVKHADVQFDIENKIRELQKKIELVGNMKKYFDGFTQSYDSINVIYKGFQNDFSGSNHFLFTSADPQVEQLHQMEGIYDDMTKNFSSYKETVALIEDAPYDQELDIKPVDEFQEIQVPDYYTERISIFNYKQWAEEAAFIISDEIMPLKNNMVSYDTQLDALLVRVNEGSTVENELAELTKKMLFEQLRNYDEDPLPTNLFNYKVSEISYYSFLNHKKGSLDSLNIDFQIEQYDTLQKHFEQSMTSFSILEAQDIDKENEFYEVFITERYTDVNGMENYISGKRTEIDSEYEYLTFKLDSLNTLAKWAYSEKDTLPMFVIDTLIIPDQFVDKSSYTFAIDTLQTNYWISGVHVSSGTISSYLSNVNFNRGIDTLIVNEVLLISDTLIIPQIKTELIPADSGRVYAVFYGKDSKGMQCVVNLIDTEKTAVLWTKSVTLTAPLNKAAVDSISQMLTLTFKPLEGGPEKDTQSVCSIDLQGILVKSDK